MTDRMIGPAEIDFIQRSLGALNEAELHVLGSDIDAWIQLPDMPIQDIEALEGAYFHYEGDYEQWILCIPRTDDKETTE